MQREIIVVRVDPCLKRHLEKVARENFRTPSQEVRRVLEAAFPQAQAQAAQ